MLTALAAVSALLATGLMALVVVLRRARAGARALEVRLGAASRELEDLQYSFSRFAPGEVVDDIIAQGVSTRSEKKEMTVLFADLRDFTAMSERLDPAVVVRILNGYFERMSAVITANRGHLSKLIGDGLLALFGALEHNPWQTSDAVCAALAMHADLVAYNDRLRSEGLPVLRVGIGIHRGTVVAGVIGGGRLVEYGVIGTTVNAASRVERLTRVHDVDILVTREVRELLDKRFRVRAMPPIAVKGFPEPLATFAIDGCEAP